jgi:hypothetical protein
MTVCGLWQGVQRLAAAIANEDGLLRPPITVPANSNNARHLLDYLADSEINTLVLAEYSHSLITLAHARRLRVRLVPYDLFEGIRIATALNRRPPRHTAILLARWPFTPARYYLREFKPITPQKSQLPLF